MTDHKIDLLVRKSSCQLLSSFLNTKLSELGLNSKEYTFLMYGKDFGCQPHKLYAF